MSVHSIYRLMRDRPGPISVEWKERASYSMMSSAGYCLFKRRGGRDHGARWPCFASVLGFDVTVYGSLLLLIRFHNRGGCGACLIQFHSGGACYIQFHDPGHITIERLIYLSFTFWHNVANPLIYIYIYIQAEDVYPGPSHSCGWVHFTLSVEISFIVLTNTMDMGIGLWT